MSGKYVHFNSFSNIITCKTEFGDKFIAIIHKTRMLLNENLEYDYSPWIGVISQYHIRNNVSTHFISISIPSLKLTLVKILPFASIFE
jgi:hypothetical protein